MRLHRTLFGLTFLLGIAACDLGPKSSYGFRLPEGDLENGRQVYIDMHCSSCHVIAGMEGLREGIDPEMSVPIGGMQTHIDTYGQLVTSVINPSHRIAGSFRKDEYTEDGKSIMRSYNDVMTVTELIDLVVFLQAQYSEFPDY